MKKSLFILLFFLPCLAFAQNKSIDGFMDIPFGSDSATVKAAISAKGGVKSDTLSEKDLLSYRGFSLSQRPVTECLVRFVNNKAFDAYFYFQYPDNDILISYDNLVRDITAIYGKPESASNFPEFRSTTAKIRKIKAKDIYIQTIWKSKNKNNIIVRINPVGQTLMLVLRYVDIPLSNIYAAKRRSDL